MPYFIYVCACCLKSDSSLCEYSIEKGRNCDSPNIYIQQIQSVYPDLKLNNTLPFQLCNDCQQLMYEAIQIKQYLDYQETNEQSQKLLLKENTCSGCLEKSANFFNQKTCNKNSIGMIREALPQYKIDSCKSYKFCQFCSNCIKSLHLLKVLITKNIILYEKYCSAIFNNTDSENLQISKLSVLLEKTAIHNFNSNFEEILIKEEISIHDDSNDIKIENIECNYNVLTNMHKTYTVCGEPLNKKDKICHQNNCNSENIVNERDFFQDPSSSESTLNVNNQISTVLGHAQDEIDMKLNNNYHSLKPSDAIRLLNENNDTSTNKPNYFNSNFEEILIKEEISVHNDRIDIKTENDECNFKFLTSMPNNYPFLEEPHKKEENICHQDNCNPENIVTESNFFQVPLNTNNQIFTVSDHNQKAVDVKLQNNIFSSKCCNAESFLNEDKNMETKKIYNCKYCVKSFTRRDYLSAHEGIHTGHKPYKCIHCLKSFTRSSYLKTHKRIHTGEVPYKCNYCSKSFNQKQGLIIHERIHTGETPFNCNHCLKSFKTKFSLTTHESIHSGAKPHKCNYCSKSFIVKSSLVVHERIHTDEKPYKCNYCSKSFNTSTHLITHERIHTGEKPYECGYCKKSFITSSDLKRHERIHTGKPYKCNECKKLFADRHQLQIHERIHTGETPFNCNYCKKSYKDRNELKAHERIHTGEKPYTCKYCAKSFTQSSSLKGHERIHTGETPFNCKHCSKTFRTKFSLTTHERIHTGETPFKCNYCIKSFKQRNDLKRHERIHTGETPFNCNYCTKSFKQKNDLKSHESIHIGEKPYDCVYCTKSFTRSNNLKTHERIHFGEKPSVLIAPNRIIKEIIENS